MNATRFFPMVVLSAALCGCSNLIEHTEPVGTDPVDLTTGADIWTGIWRLEDKVWAVAVEDAPRGILSATSSTPIGWMRWENNTSRIYLRKGGNLTYASLELQEGTNVCFIAGQVENSGHGVVVWWILDGVKMRPLVEAGLVPGTIESRVYMKSETETNSYECVRLGTLQPPHFDLIAPSTNRLLCCIDVPFVYARETARTDRRSLRAAQKRWMREYDKGGTPPAHRIRKR